MAAIISVSAYAQDPMTEIINTIVANNPEIASQRELIKAQGYENTDANSIENPQVGFSRVWGRHGVGNKLQLDVSQSFDWPGLYRARSQAAKQGISAAEMAAINAALDISLEAKQSLTELVYIRKQLDLGKKILSYIEEMIEANKKAEAKGTVTILNGKKLQLENYKIDAEIAQLEAREQQVEAQLQAMCIGPDLDLSGINAYAIEKIMSESEYVQLMQETDPMLGAHKFTMEQEELNAKAATQSRFPSFSVGYQHQAEMGDRFNGFTVGMSLPFFQNRKARAAALSRKEATHQSALALEDKRIADIHQEFAEMELWKKQVKAYEEVFGDNKYLEILTKMYEGGEINILEYLAEIRYYCESTYAFLEAEYNYQLAAACLNRYALLAQ